MLCSFEGCEDVYEEFAAGKRSRLILNILCCDCWNIIDIYCWFVEEREKPLDVIYKSERKLIICVSEVIYFLIILTSLEMCKN
jgi:hypothetical protein